MSEPNRPPPHDGTPLDPRIRHSWWIFAGTILLLGLLLVARLVIEGAGPLDWVLAALVLVVGIAAIRHREAVTALEIGRRAEAESFARILSGLSRSVSEDAIVGAIVEELAGATGADHIVVARRRPDVRALQTTLISARPGVPPSTTLLPLDDLDGDRPVVPRPAVAIPVVVDLADLGVAAAPIPLGAVAGGTPAGGTPAGGTPAGGTPAGGTPAATMAATAVTASGWRRRGESASSDLSWRLSGERPRPVSPGSARPRPMAPGPARPPASRASLDQEAAQAAADRIAEQVRSAYGLTHMLAAPLRARDGITGAIVLSRRSGAPWPATTRRLLTGAALEASAALSRAGSHRAAELEASTDALTGLPNRRYFDEFCGLLARRRRAEDAVGVLMIDIDRFKVLNDTYGHAAGDDVLKAVGGAIVGAVRDDDVPARYGGEEFVVLLRNPTGPIALEIGERVRAAVAELDLSRQRIPGVTVSVGVAVADQPDEPIGYLIEEADRALFRAKRGGRNRVVAA